MEREETCQGFFVRLDEKGAEVEQEGWGRKESGKKDIMKRTRDRIWLLAFDMVMHTQRYIHRKA